FFLYGIARPVWREEKHRLLPSATRIRNQIIRLGAAALMLAIISGAGWFVLQAAVMSRQPLTQALSDGVAWTVLTQTRFGHVSALRTLLAIGMAVVLYALARGRWGATTLAGAVLGAVFLGSLAWVG